MSIPLGRLIVASVRNVYHRKHQGALGPILLVQDLSSRGRACWTSSVVNDPTLVGPLCVICSTSVYGIQSRGGGTKKKVGGLTLPLNDCTEAGVQGLHSEEFFCPLASEKVVGLSPPTSQSGGAKAPSAPPGSATPGYTVITVISRANKSFLMFRR